MIILLRRKDLVLQGPVAAQSDRQRNLVDVPVALQPHARRPLIRQAHEPGVGQLILEARRPVHDVGVAQIGIAPGGVAAAEAGARIGNRAVGIDRVLDRPRAVLQLEYVPRVAGRLQDVERCRRIRRSRPGRRCRRS